VAIVLGRNARAIFGCAVSGAGDVKADGYDEVVVGAYGDDSGFANAGSATALSGKGLQRAIQLPWNGRRRRAGTIGVWCGRRRRRRPRRPVVAASVSLNRPSDRGSAQVFCGRTLVFCSG